MQKTIRTTLSSRGLVAIAASAALLAALFLIQGPAFHAAAAAPARHAIAAPRATLFYPPCDSADITQVDSPHQQGVPVALTGSSTGCLNPVYRFLVLAPGATTWVFKTAYQGPEFIFNTTGLKDGVWQVGVWAKAATSSARYQAWSINSVHIQIPYCTGVRMIPYVPSPQKAGTSVAFFSVAAGCPNATYEIWKLSPGSSTWVDVKPYVDSTSTTLIWDTSGIATGAYRWVIWARIQGSPHRYDTYGTLTYWIQ